MNYVLRLVCRPLLLQLLLVCQPAVENSEVITYREQQLKTKCPLQPLFEISMLYFFIFGVYFLRLTFLVNSTVAPFLFLAHLPTTLHSCMLSNMQLGFWRTGTERVCELISVGKNLPRLKQPQVHKISITEAVMSSQACSLHLYRSLFPRQNLCGDRFEVSLGQFSALLCVQRNERSCVSSFGSGFTSVCGTVALV